VTARDETKTLIARQIATAHGVIFIKAPPRYQMEMLTLAENILATVERKMFSVSGDLERSLEQWIGK
jgi:hypothetical protein